ncbi:flavodoxin [Lachnospiraceae bacterium C1.1]|nr:flavodoxin [Lachnospiraceae bacterium C1.1]
MIPFCTSSSSGIGRSGQNLADKAGSGTWLDGKRFGAGASEDEIKSWIEGLQ